MPKVMITPTSMQHRPSPYADLLKRAGFEVRYPTNPELVMGLTGEEETISQLKGMKAVIAGGEYFTPGSMDGLPELRVIARAGVGFDRVDVEAATRRGVAVTVTPTANHEAVAEHAITLLLTTVRSIIPTSRQVAAGRWPREPLGTVRGKTLGIVGLGRIGRSTAVRAIPLGMKVVAHEIFPDQEFVGAHGIELLSFEQLLEALGFHHPALSADGSDPALLRKSGVRSDETGEHSDQHGPWTTGQGEDLLEALRSGRLRAAGLDVLEQEPPDPDNPLLRMGNVLVTSHQAGCDEASVIAMGMEAAQCIITLNQGNCPKGGHQRRAEVRLEVVTPERKEKRGERKERKRGQRGYGSGICFLVELSDLGARSSPTRRAPAKSG